MSPENHPTSATLIACFYSSTSSYCCRFSSLRRYHIICLSFLFFTDSKHFWKIISLFVSLLLQVPSIVVMSKSRAFESDIIDPRIVCLVVPQSSDGIYKVGNIACAIRAPYIRHAIGAKAPQLATDADLLDTSQKISRRPLQPHHDNLQGNGIRHPRNY